MEKLSVISKFLQESDWIEGLNFPIEEYNKALQMNYPIEEGFVPNHVINHVWAFLYVYHHRNDLPSIQHVHELHKRLMAGEKPHHVGTFRKYPTIVNKYIPPGPEHIPSRMLIWQEQVQHSFNPWNNFLQFEIIQPYANGNGQLGRLLWAWERLHYNFELVPFLETTFRDISKYLNSSIDFDLSNEEQLKYLRCQIYYKSLLFRGEQFKLDIKDFDLRNPQLMYYAQ